MALYVDSDDFDAVVDGTVRLALFDDTTAGDGSGYSSTLFDRAANFASILARAAAENAGYAPGDTSTNDAVKIVALAALVGFAYGRKGRTMPEATATLLGGLLEGVRAGDVPIPDLTPDAGTGVGGVESTNRSTTSTAGYPPIFRNLHKVR